MRPSFILAYNSFSEIFIRKANSAVEIRRSMLASIINHRQQFTGVSLHECEEGGDIIPEQRRKLGGVKYCIECQSYFEAKGK